MENIMDITVIDKIIKWIPFKNLRNNLREYMYFQFYIYEQLKNYTNDKEYIRELMLLKHQDNSDVFWVKKFREEAQKDTNLKTKYIEFTKNLDQNSLEIVSEMLSKLLNYKDINDPIYFEYYQLKEINDIAYKHWSKVTKIDNQYYAYEKYIIPIRNFQEDIFFDKLGINNLKTKTNIQEKDIIDAGAWIGDSSIVLSYFTNKNVHAFEPISKNYDILLETIKLNKIDNIIPIKKALGDKNYNINVESSFSSLANINNVSETEYSEKVEVITLDDYVNKNKLNIGLIKTDLEGFEQKFLNGAINTIIEQKPTLMISIYHSYNDFFEIKSMLEKLKLGYKFQIYKFRTSYILSDTKLIAECY